MTPDPEQGPASRRPDHATIRDWLVRQLAARASVPEHAIDPRANFDSYGLGSKDAVALSGDLETWLGCRLSPTLLYEYPTSEALARYLAGTSCSPADDGPAAAAAGEPEPVAIVGMACRFPSAPNLGAFWRLLCEGRDAIGEVPPDRWDSASFYDADPHAPGKAVTRWGGFLPGIDRFDARFFGIAPREAQRMDPQQRLLLEMAWEALEDAGQLPGQLAGSRTGVFVGISTNEYGRIQFGDLKLIDAYAGTGNALSIAANRISYQFDLRGPSMAVDTACSASLVAVHLACASLANGESTLALAGGVSLILSPAVAINFSKAGVMAPDGRCKSFDARANGYVRGEGAGMVVLKPLSQALAGGDPIYAVIRGSATGHDGRSNGLMAPSREAQEAVLRAAYNRAGIAPAHVQYVEAHGTGTFLGDPIEAKALGAVMRVGRPNGQPCRIGSVKTNIGHLEAAAGIASLIKVSLALKHRALPPSLNYREPNPHIPFAELGLCVQQQLTSWPEAPGLPAAGVSSFGFGGTNAHVVLQAAPETAACPTGDELMDAGYLLPLSAHAPEALQEMVQSYKDWLPQQDPRALRDICYTAAARRTQRVYGVAVVGATPQKLAERLAVLPADVCSNKVGEAQPRIAFVFPGQGGQWAGMGRELLAQEPVFRSTVAQCEQAMAPHIADRSWSLAEILTAPAEDSRLAAIDVVQPALFAMQVGLAALWRAWGITPDAVVGHSLGEVAAAHVAGALSLEDAARVICLRSRLMRQVAGQGAMAAIGLSLEEAEQVIAGYGDRLAVAVSNGPASCVLSGDPGALAEVVVQLAGRGIFVRPVPVDVAAHSPQMAPLASKLVTALAGLQPQVSTLPIYSTVTGQPGYGYDLDADYWGRNLREPVRFWASAGRLLDDGYPLFLELSPHPTLISALQQGAQSAGQQASVFGSLRRDERAREALLRSLGGLHSRGCSVAWDEVYPGGRCVALPGYPWQRERYWLDSGDATLFWRNPPGAEPRRDRPGPAEASGHPLLGRRLPLALDQAVFETQVSSNILPYLDDHRVYGMAVLPGTAYLELALAAAAAIFAGQSSEVENVLIQEALILPPDEPQQVQTVVERGEEGRAEFRIASRGPGESAKWVQLASGTVRAAGISNEKPERVALEELQHRLTRSVTADAHYQRYEACGITYGPAFQGVRQIWRRDGEALGRVELPYEAAGDSATYWVHPALLDACLQVLGACLPEEEGAGMAYMPVAVDRCRLYTRPARAVWSHAVLHAGEPDAETLVGNVHLYDDAGELLMVVEGVHLKRAQRSSVALSGEARHWLYEIAWDEAGSAAAQAAVPQADGRWLILADTGGLGAELAQVVAGRGQPAVLVLPGTAYQRQGSASYMADPACPRHMHTLLHELAADGGPAFSRIVHLWSLDSDLAGDPEYWQARGPGSALALAQALCVNPNIGQPRLWLVTRGCQPVNPGCQPVNPAQAPVWGFGRVLALEHPELWGGLVDLDPSRESGEATWLWEHVTAVDGEDQVACRARRRYAARLVRRVAVERQTLSIRPDGTYLITGGLGRLGLRVALWLAEHGAQHLVLVSRSGLPSRDDWRAHVGNTPVARRIHAVRRLEAQGAAVEAVAADTADAEQMEALFERLRRCGRKLRGVIHAAGISAVEEVQAITPGSLRAVLAAKMAGAWNLHRLSCDAELDFFVLFSSAAAIWGSRGLAHYAAANHFLDALAHYRRATGLPALSINWARFSDPGMVGADEQAALARIGIEPVPVEQALELMGALVSAGVTQRTVAAVDWQVFRPVYETRGGRSFLQHIAGPQAARLAQTGGLAHDILEQLRDALPGQRRDLLRDYVCREVAQVLGFDRGHALDPSQGFFEMGMDSLMAVQINGRLEAVLGKSLPSTLAFDYPNIEALTGYLLGTLFGPGTQVELQEVRAAEPERASAAPPDIDSLSEDEIVALLAQELRSIKGGSGDGHEQRGDPRTI